MEFTKNTIKEDHLVSYVFTAETSDNLIIRGTIATNSILNTVCFSLNRIQEGISFAEPIHLHPWFLKELIQTKDAFLNEKKMSDLFA